MKAEPPPVKHEAKSNYEFKGVGTVILPHFEMKQPKIYKTLPDNLGRNSEPNLLILSALEVIDFYPQNSIHIFTDGSAFKATINARYGGTIRYLN